MMEDTLRSSALLSALVWFADMFLLAVFALAAAAKLRDRERARSGLLGFGVPERWARPALAGLVGAELLLVALLAYPPTRPAGAWCALGALAVFTLAIAWQLLHGRRPACACFGALTPAAVSWKSVGRNLLLMALAGASIALPRSAAPPLPPDAIPWPTLIAVAWGIASAVWLLLLTRQNGRLLLRLEQLEQRAGISSPAPSAEPVRAGAPVPPLGLSDARGRPFDLRDLRGRPALLLFLDAACNHCRPVLARLRDAQLPGSAALVVISESDALQRELPAEITVLVDPTWSAAVRFGARGAPAAVALDADGTLAHGVVHGTAPVQALLDRMTSQEVRHELAPV